MKQNKQEIKEKTFINLRKRSTELRSLIRKFPFRKLEEPFQDGWTLQIELSQEGLKHKKASKFSEAMKHVRHNYVTRDPAAITKIRKNPKLKDVKQLFYYTTTTGFKSYYGPSLSSMSEKSYKDVPDDLKTIFYRVEHQTVVWRGGEPYKYYTYSLDIPEHLLIVRARKRMVTMIQDINPELLKEQAEVEGLLEEHWLTHRHYRDEDSYRNPKNSRRHSKDAIRKIMTSDIDDIGSYKKMSKMKESNK